jgi:hypothetical protein
MGGWCRGYYVGKGISQPPVYMLRGCGVPGQVCSNYKENNLVIDLFQVSAAPNQGRLFPERFV